MEGAATPPPSRIPDRELVALRVNPTSPFRCRRRDLVVLVVAVVVVVVTDGNFEWYIDWFRERSSLTLSLLGCSWGPRGTIGVHFWCLLVPLDLHLGVFGWPLASTLGSQGGTPGRFQRAVASKRGGLS